MLLFIIIRIMAYALVIDFQLLEISSLLRSSMYFNEVHVPFNLYHVSCYIRRLATL